MVAAEPGVQQADEATASFVRERALAIVATNLAPAPFLLLPFTLLVSSLLRKDVSSVRLGWWLLTSVGATAITLFALYRYYMRGDSSGTPRMTQLAIGASFASIGLLFGICPWVATDHTVEVILLFTLFPSTASAVGCIVTAGRRDLFLAFLVPLVGSLSWSLIAAPDSRLRGLGIIAIFFGFGLLILHHVVSRNTIDAIRLQWRSERLLRDLAHERSELTGVNEQLATTNRRLAHQATHDPLTGLFNRRGTLELLEQTLNTAGEQSPVGLLFCDLDRFKAVNDALGHRGGDRFISIIADRLSRSLEPGCIAGRMGGDEFVVVLPGMDIGATAAIANRLVGVLAQPVYAEGREVPSSVSIGVAVSPQHGSAASELLRHANAALYRAKAGGRNRVEMFDGAMQQEMVSRLEGEQALRRAIDDGEILAFFQPEIDATSGSVVGAELLARWVRRDGTVTSAQEFLAVAISAGLLERVTDKVISSARPHMRRLALLGLPEGFRFRINTAPAATERSWRDDPIDQMLQGIDPAWVTVDVRESSVDGDLPSAAANLASFRARGGRVCLDDFARGVSSLSLLRRLPLDEVRIDRVSIDTITAHPHDRAIVRSIIALVREIGLAVTADGVETGAQADALIALGCVRQQGHLYAPALPAGEFEDYLLARMAERYAAALDPRPTWETGDLT
ncbi:MAG: EAL domain-containing protein [Actinomycetota bacterium]|nr:EAL domain-containing protein [Actinomycetota bacterium]